MTSAFGGQHSIQLSYGCALTGGTPVLTDAPQGRSYKENGPALQSGPAFPSDHW
jgi:hypothetical protein